jgi:D-aminopeptidase
VNKTVLFVTDLEGIPEMDSWDYEISEESRRKAVLRLNQVIRHILTLLMDRNIYDRYIVFEGHHNSIVSSELYDNVEIVRQNSKTEFFPIIKENFDLMMIGAHGSEGSGCLLDHSFSSRNPQKWFIGDVEVGEVGITNIWANSQSSPCIFVHGNKTACSEINKLSPNTVALITRCNDREISIEDEMVLLESTILEAISKSELISDSISDCRLISIKRIFVGKKLIQKFRAYSYMLLWSVAVLMTTGKMVSARSQEYPASSVVTSLNSILLGPLYLLKTWLLNK